MTIFAFDWVIPVAAVIFVILWLIVRSTERSFLIFGSVFLMIAIIQHFFLSRAGHYIPVFDELDGITFGLALISLALWMVRKLRKA